MERPRAGGSGYLDLGGRRAREWKAKVEGINRGDQTAYGVAVSLPRGREQLLDHGSKPLEGAPPATEYRSDVTLYLALVVGTSASGHDARPPRLRMGLGATTILRSAVGTRST